MTELPERIKQLREERTGSDGDVLSIEEAANALKPRTTGKTWSKWERGPGKPGGGEPALAKFRSLMAFFGVSADYLLGVTDDRQPASDVRGATRDRPADHEGSAEIASARGKRRAGGGQQPRRARRPRDA